MTLLLALALLAADPAAPAAATAPLRYPETRRGDVVDDYFGNRIADPYRWLEDDRSEETHAWVMAQAAFAEAWLEKVPARAALRERLTRLMDYERFSSPFRKGHRYFYSRNSGLQPQSVVYVTDDPAREGRVLLDPNGLSSDGTVALAGLSVSDDGKRAAYAVADAGSDWITWRVRDVDTGKDRPDVVRWSKASGASWRKDGSGFYYSRFDAPREGDLLKGANQKHKVYFHALGTRQEQDVLIYARPDQPEWYLGAEVTDDGRWLVIQAGHGTRPERAVFLADLRRKAIRVEPFLDRMDAAYDVVDSDGDTFYVLTDQGAPRKRLVAIRRGQPDPRGWRVVIPEGPDRDVMQAVALVGGKLIVTWMRDARSAVEVYGLDGRRLAEVALPSVGSVTGFAGKRSHPETFYLFTGFLAPPSIFRLDMRTLASTPFRTPRTAFDSAPYHAEQVFYTSKDGTRVPMFLVHRRDLVRDGRTPTLLYGYGGFNIPMTPRYSLTAVAWLELGGIWAVANLRGGSEYGKAWYEGGRLAHKQNVFDDFIAAAEYLVAERWTSTPRLAIDGGSNGGLLVAACLTQRPDLFGAAVPEVGVLDMLRFQKFTLGWGWTSDYGSSDDPAGFEVLRRYSPLHNLKPGTHYPPTLIVTADHDDRVVPAHSFKFAAALQAAQGGPAPVLARIETRAGHGAGKPTAKIIEERADVLAFLVAALGLELPPGGVPGGK
jgi:prolyl oligopeptidase